MDSFLKRYSNALILTALLVAQVLGLAVQVKGTTESGASSNLLHVWAIRLIAPIEKGFVHSGNATRNLYHDYFALRTVRKENESLKKQIEDMRLQNVRLQEDAMQARRIQSLLGFKEQFIHKTVAAQVIGTSGSDLSRIIYIDRGSEDGIKTDMAVITPDGVVGKVLKVDSKSTATVLLINDQTSGVGALLVNLRLQGIVKGTAGGDIVLNNIMQNEKVEVGDLITTSGGDRIFPKGLPIGTVSSTFPGRDVFLNVRLKPAARLDRLEEVLVVTEIKNQEPDTKDLGPIRAADILAARLPSVPQQTTAAPGTTPGATTQGSAPATSGANAVTPQQTAPATSQPQATTVPKAASKTGVPGTTAAPTGATAKTPATTAPKSNATDPAAAKPAVPKKPNTPGSTTTPQTTVPQGRQP